MSEETRYKGNFEVDMSKLEGDIVLCPNPKCGTTIDPNNENDYVFLDTKREKGELKELTIGCQKCYSKIRLTGFLDKET